MSKTAEQVVNDALYAANSGTITGTVLSALRSAGWLREANEIPHVVALEGYKRTVEQLTRERDEARAESWCYKTLAQKNYDTAASPEVVRVVEAAKAWRDKVWSATFITDYERALRAAVDALSASRQPKAQEPRWTTEPWPKIAGWSTGGWGVNKGDKWYGPFVVDVCHKLADILNAEAK